jgi:hypothetical protein
MTFEQFCKAVERLVSPTGHSWAIRAVTGDVVWQAGEYRCSLEPREQGVRCRLWHASDAGLTTQNIELGLTLKDAEIVAAAVKSLAEGPPGAAEHD